MMKAYKDRIKQFGIANYESFLKAKTTFLQIFINHQFTHYVAKYNYSVLEINEVTTKTVTKK